MNDRIKKSNRIFLLDPVDRYFIVLEERPSYYFIDNSILHTL